MATTLTTSAWLFPPRTREVQFDEAWSFVATKEKTGDPAHPADDHTGDWGDQVASDPEPKLVRAAVPGARVTESAEEVVAEVKDRLGGQPPELRTSDEQPADETALETAFSQVVAAEEAARPGRRLLLPTRRLAPRVASATVHTEREKGRVVAVRRTVVLGSQQAVDRALQASVGSRTLNPSLVARRQATDRGRNARKAGRTCRFAKDWRVHEAMTSCTLSRDNFCWAVRT